MRNIPLIIEDEINNVNIEEISTSKTIKKEEMKKFEEENPLIENIEKIMENREKELSPDCFSGADNAPSELLNKFINIDINILTPLLNPRNSFFIKLSTEKIMSWQNKEIDIPFLKMTDNLKPISIQIFRNLLSYMKDRKSSKQPIFHIRKFHRSRGKIKLDFTRSLNLSVTVGDVVENTVDHKRGVVKGFIKDLIIVDFDGVDKPYLFPDCFTRSGFLQKV